MICWNCIRDTDIKLFNESKISVCRSCGSYTVIRLDHPYAETRFRPESRTNSAMADQLFDPSTYPNYLVPGEGE